MGHAPQSEHANALVHHFSSLTMDRVSSSARAAARCCVLDSLGCMIFGAGQPWSRAAALAASKDRSSRDCTVVGQTGGYAAAAAALCNGIATHGYELDNLIASPVVHPGTIVIPAVLAAGESERVSGERALLGVVAGYEAMARIGTALGPEPAKRGYHVTGLAGPIAATVAAGVACGFDADRMLSAIGLACSTAAGIKSFAGGSGGGMVKRMHAGRAAEAGVRVCQLAQCGFEGPRAAIDGHFGLL